MTEDDFITHKEPDEIFLPLSDERYSRFYAMEMADFQADLPFYRQHVTIPGATLELGCGNGRLCRLLARSGAQITGIDRSCSMLRLARQAGPSAIRYLGMDMTALAFCRHFDTVIVPYHTFNLLRTRERINQCLAQIRATLAPRGCLLMQLFIPDQTIQELGEKKRFQFQIFPHPDGGKIIKETRRSFHHDQLILEERYRIRPQHPEKTREDLSHTLHLAAFPVQTWEELLHTAGFTILQQFGGYDLTPFVPGRDSCLLLHAQLT